MYEKKIQKIYTLNYLHFGRSLLNLVLNEEKSRAAANFFPKLFWC